MGLVATAAALYFGRDIFLPLATAILLTFALAPAGVGIAQAARAEACRRRDGGRRRLRRHHSVRHGRGQPACKPGRKPAALSEQHRGQGAVHQGREPRRRTLWAGLQTVREARPSDRGRKASGARRGRSRRACRSSSAAGPGGRSDTAAAAGAADDHRSARRASRDGRHRHRRGHLHVAEAGRSEGSLHTPCRRRRHSPDDRGDRGRGKAGRPVSPDATGRKRDLRHPHCDRALGHRRAQRAALGSAGPGHAVRPVHRTGDFVHLPARTGARGRFRMVDAAVDGCLVHRRRASQQQCRRAMALRLANRPVALGHHRGRGPVDLALGASRVAACPPRSRSVSSCWASMFRASSSWTSCSATSRSSSRISNSINACWPAIRSRRPSARRRSSQTAISSRSTRPSPSRRSRSANSTEREG